MQDKNTYKKNLSKILADNKERLKELMCINTTTNIIEETTYFKRVRFKKNINVFMDGKKQISVILWED